MKIKFTTILYSIKKRRLLTMVMRTFIFLFIFLTFGFSPKMGYSQKDIIRIKSNNETSVNQVFDLIIDQTNYNFIYSNELFVNTPKIKLEKGEISVAKLLERCLSNTDFTYVFSNNTIVLTKKTPAVKEQKVATVMVTGVVKDINGEVLPGVNVLEKGTKNLTVTNVLGKFQISVKDKNSVLAFSFVGYQTEEVLVGNNAEMNVSLKKSVQLLQSVNVISTGYQNLSKDKLTGAAEKIDKSYFDNSYKSTLQEGLQGSVAGLQIFTNNNHPQAIPQVIIRGVGSAFQEGVNVTALGSPRSVLGNPPVLTPGSPLYVIDGVPTTDGSDLTSISGSDIMSITVLKDAGATGIYGARGANGVIVVETKSGAKGKGKITYSSQFGVSNFVSLNRILNTAELQELYVEGLINNPTNGINTEAAALAFLSSPGGTAIPFNPNVNTNWIKELTRPGKMTQHNISASGGKDSNRFYLSFGYLKNETGMKEIDFDRTTIKLKYDTEFSSKFDVSTNFAFGNTNSGNYETGNSLYNPFLSIYRLRPDLGLFRPDGSYDTSYNFGINPLGTLRDEIREVTTNDFRGSVETNYKIIPNLTFNTILSADYKLTENFNNFPSFLGKGINNSGRSYGIQQNTNDLIWNARALLRYDFKLGDHSIKSFVGLENTASDIKTTNVSVENLRFGAQTLENGLTVDTYTRRVETALSSIFLNTDYAYKENYLLSMSFRRDGSSKFGSTNRYGNFFSVGLGWNMHKESFLANVSAINTLKLRSSYGVNGNDQIGNFNYVGTFDGTRFYNGQNVATIATAGNESLSWEKNKSFNTGVDFSLFKNRVSGTVDYFIRNTSDLLFNLAASSFNPNNFIFQNFGGMKNTGIELTLNTVNFTQGANKFGWTTDLNFSTYRNEVTNLATDEIISGNYLRKIGQDFNTLNLFGYAGVDPQTGNELFYKDQTKTETTSLITEAKKFNQGKTTPDFYGSMTNTFSYKNFSLTAQLYTSWGGQIFENAAQSDNGSLGITALSNTSRSVYERRWRKPGDVTDVPKYVFGQTRPEALSTRWLRDGSYIRLRRVEMAYLFSSAALKKLAVDRLRFYVSGDNFWTYVKDKKLENDPEIGGITGASGLDAPLAKTIFFGLNVTF